MEVSRNLELIVPCVGKQARLCQPNPEELPNEVYLLPTIGDAFEQAPARLVEDLVTGHVDHVDALDDRQVPRMNVLPITGFRLIVD
jgi:hypothetical protein